MSYKQARTVNQGVRYTLGSDFSDVSTSDLTYIFVWNPSSVNPMGLIRFLVGGSATEGINPYSDGKIYFSLSGFAASTASYTATDGWRIDVIRKPPNGAGTPPPRHSYFLYNEGVWHHSDFGSSIANTSTHPTELYLWTFNPGSAESMDGMAAGACIVKGILADADCPGLELGVPEWMSRGYHWMVSHFESPNETSATQEAAKPFGASVVDSAFGSFGAFGPSGISWPDGYSIATLAHQYNPPAPWSYAKVAQDPDAISILQQRSTFKGTRGDAAGWTLGSQLSLPGDGSVSAIWWNPPDQFIGDFTWRIDSGYRDEGGSMLATGTVLSADYDHAGGWQRFPITPVDVSGINFMVSYYAPGSGNGHYRYSPMNDDGFPGSLFTPDGLIYFKAGCFASSHNRPDTGSNNCFSIDVEITADSAPPPSFNAAQFFPYFN